MSKDEQVTVEQCDIDAALEHYPEHLWKQAARDDLAKAFARNRAREIAKAKAAYADGYTKAIEDAAKVASLYIIEKNSIHPDIGSDGMSEMSKMIARTTCQYVAEAILTLEAPQPQEDGEDATDVNEPLIASLTYKGNSVTWWHSKAENYKAALGRAWDALIENGINPDGETDVADAIRAIGQNANGKTRNEHGKPDAQPTEKA